MAYALARGFDFDSPAMVQAKEPTFLENFEQETLPILIDYLAAFVVIGIGAIAIKWFVLGAGTAWLIQHFATHAPTLINMVTIGQL